MSDTLNIFAIGNVLDPHVRIEGRCRACTGTGKGTASACAACGGIGEATALVRLSEVVSPLQGAEFVGTEVEVFGGGK
jgi:DnaJ-class molecular chaperone